MTKNASEFGTRTVYTFALLASAANHALNRASQAKSGYFYDCLHAIVSSAFALEAYFNHLGPKLLAFWIHLDRLGPKEKLAVICGHLKLKPAFRERPFQSVDLAFKVRNLAAHGRTEALPYSRRVPWGHGGLSNGPKSELERLCTVATARRIVKDSQAVVEQLHERAGVKSVLLWSLSQTAYTRRPDA